MKTFLVPTDFSENATNALNYAAALASEVKGKLIIVHVINLIVIPVRSGKLVNLTDETEIDYYLQLNEIASSLRTGKNLECEIKVIDQYQYGSFQASLNHLIMAKEVDLVVMGTKGATNILKKLFGTNTSEFIKETVCPVLVIPANTLYYAINHIAYASYFESDETIYLKQVFKFADSFPSPLPVSILSVIRTIPPENKSPQEPDFKDIAKNFPHNRYSITQVNEIDDITGIQTFLTDNEIDLLAISIPEQSLWEDLFQRSISKQLIYYTTLPLLALPENLINNAV